MVLRSNFGLLALAAAVAAGPLLVSACASREWAHAPSASSEERARSKAATDVDGGSPFISANADPICGDGWRWTGMRCQQSETVVGADDTLASSAKPGPKKPARRVAGALVMSDIKPGDGKEARRGDTVRVQYVGTLPDGTEFDNSRVRDTPLTFQLGTGAVIKGFDTAITGMKVGGTRRVTIPPELGYGAQGSPPRIPPNATLIFEIELLDVLTD